MARRRDPLELSESSLPITPIIEKVAEIYPGFIQVRVQPQGPAKMSAGFYLVTEAVQAQVEQLLADAATPVAQLLTQAHLLETEERPVQAKDALAVAKRLVRTLEDHGLAWVDLDELSLRMAAASAYTEQRLRPRVRVSLEEIQTAYQELVVSELEREGQPVPPLTARYCTPSGRTCSIRHGSRP